tara:strand:- start:252 stop:476 length:225 start_codon:yes stop_codon:yes gene_type:complete
MTALTRHSCTATPITKTSRPSIRAFLARAYGLWVTRRALAGLTPAQLEDVGVTQAEAHREANRPVWDVPANWRD